MNIGIQGKEATEHFPEQTNIPGTGKAVAVESDFNVHPAQQIAPLKAFNLAMFNLGDSLQSTSVHFVVRPVIQRQRAAQHFSVIHHPQKTATQMAQHPPMKTVTVGRIARQRRRRQITHPNLGTGRLHHSIQYRAL
ncbi:Uncharacterised protein [Yersinia pseudotuberculosis]|nr:Uncharacterised protein [Yersinia pseudotuberculosis]